MTNVKVWWSRFKHATFRGRLHYAQPFILPLNTEVDIRFRKAMVLAHNVRA